ncbi:unnamed protein product, partial [Polarella glacialis]
AAAAVALAAAARAETFQAAAGQAALAHAQRTELGQRAEDLRERLQVLAPETQRLQTEIQAAEERQQELLMHMKENKELLDGLKKRRAETRKQEGYLTSDLLRADGVYASKLADEDESKQRAEASRALAHAVAEVASNFKTQSECIGSRNSQARLLVAAARSRHQAAECVLDLARHEARRLSLAAEAAQAAVRVAVERQQSRAAERESGVSASAESEGTGQAETSQALLVALGELQRCCRNILSPWSMCFRSSSLLRPRLVDHYAVLDVMESVTMAALRSSYRRMALRTHPDKGGSPEDFRQVLEAFAVLSSSRTRSAYDSSLRARKEAAGSRSGRTTREKPEEERTQPASSSPQQQTADARHESESSSVPPPTAENAANSNNCEAQGQGCSSDAEKQASTQPSSTYPAKQGVFACMARLRTLAFQMSRTQREASLQALLPQVRSRLLEFMQGHNNRKAEVGPGKAQHRTAERRHPNGACLALKALTLHRKECLETRWLLRQCPHAVTRPHRQHPTSPTTTKC